MRALAIVLLLAGCATPEGDGFYRCARSGQCPSTAPICGSDGLCHTSAVDASTIDASSPPDAGPMPLTYDDCVGRSADMACQGVDTCYFDTTPLATSNDGYCTRACTGDGDCPSYDGAPSACVTGRCRRGSTGSADCPDAFGSTTGRWEDGRALRLCLDLNLAEANWYATCSIDGDCERPLSCVHGVCLRACTTTGDCVQDLEVCVASATGAHGCLYECTGAADCTSLDATCGVGGGCHPSSGW